MEFRRESPMVLKAKIFGLVKEKGEMGASIEEIDAFILYIPRRTLQRHLMEMQKSRWIIAKGEARATRYYINSNPDLALDNDSTDTTTGSQQTTGRIRANKLIVDGALKLNTRTENGAVTILSTDVFVVTTANNTEFTLPVASTNTGRVIYLSTKGTDSDVFTVIVAGGENIYLGDGTRGSTAINRKRCQLISDGENWIEVSASTVNTIL